MLWTLHLTSSVLTTSHGRNLGRLLKRVSDTFARPNSFWRPKVIPPDPTDEIRAIKRKLAAECDYDIHRIAEQARRRQREFGRKSVTLPPRPRTADNTANPSMHSTETGGRD
jgi:hypothetical protein